MAWWRWLTTWALLAAPGVGLGMLQWGPVVVACVVAIPGAMVGITYALHRIDDWRAAGTPPSGSLVQAAGVALCSGVITCSLSALADLSPLLGAGVLLLVGATIPPITARLRQMRGSRSPVGHGPGAFVERSPTIREIRLDPVAPTMSDRELCRVWRHSFGALHDATSPAEILRVVALRQSYLDELESRNAGAFEAWLASGARPGGGPERFFAKDTEEDLGAA